MWETAHGSDVFKVSKLTRCHAPPAFSRCRRPAHRLPIVWKPRAHGATDDRSYPRNPAGVTPAPHLPEWRLWPPVPTSKLLRRSMREAKGVNKSGRFFARSNEFNGLRGRVSTLEDGLDDECTVILGLVPRICLGCRLISKHLRAAVDPRDKPEDDGPLCRDRKRLTLPATARDALRRGSRRSVAVLCGRRSAR